MGELVVHLKNITKAFGNVVAVDNLSLDVEKGHIVTLLGPSGCGKTTALRIVAGFYKPDVGDVYIGGKLVTGLPPFKRNTAMVFQDYALFPHLNVFDNIAYGLKIKKLPRKEIGRKLENIFKLCKIEGLEKRGVDKLSGGQQQRVALARALVMEPEVLLLDEPLSNLDAKLRVNVRAEIRQIQQNTGIAAIYVTHDQEEALAISDKIVIMDQGSLIEEGTPKEIYLRPRKRFTAGFVGSRNFVEGYVAKTIPGGMLIDIGASKMLSLNPITSLKEGDRVKLTCFSRSIALSKEYPGKENTLSGRIEFSSFLGPTTQYLVDTDGIKWRVEMSDSISGQILEGDVFIHFNRDGFHFLK